MLLDDDDDDDDATWWCNRGERPYPQWMLKGDRMEQTSLSVCIVSPDEDEENVDMEN